MYMFTSVRAFLHHINEVNEFCIWIRVAVSEVANILCMGKYLCVHACVFVPANPVIMSVHTSTRAG